MVTIPSLKQTCGVADSYLMIESGKADSTSGSFLTNSDLMIESGLADFTSGSIDILKLIPPPQWNGMEWNQVAWTLAIFAWRWDF